MVRLFVAVALPEAVKGRLEALRETREGVRWIRPTQLHLTLRFIGEVEEERVASIMEAMERVPGTGFSLRLEGVGVFPGRRRPRVLWVGVRPEAGLITLQESIEQALHACGLPADDKPFHPHVTLARMLARIKSPDKDWVRTFLQQHHTFDAGTVDVTAFHLYASTLGPGAAVHERLASFPLS